MHPNAAERKVMGYACSLCGTVNYPVRDGLDDGTLEGIMGKNAFEERCEEITVFGKPALFTGGHIEPCTVPRGYHRYEMRHDDAFDGYAVEIARSVTVNLWGTVITRDEISLPRSGHRSVVAGDLRYGAGDCRSMAGFMEKYPATAKPPKTYER